MLTPVWQHDKGVSCGHAGFWLSANALHAPVIAHMPASCFPDCLQLAFHGRALNMPHCGSGSAGFGFSGDPTRNPDAEDRWGRRAPSADGECKEQDHWRKKT
eukprot:scaffold126510_cov23-Tisochrysis_lutea.AAC.1